ncbi:uncharacterized protein LOC143197723 [Rhynchophorus ferrugineus]|uniref:uncharacterized protein LOC143197723 n=1 Tax=Rhynchophorus ferrugineus TaxID=354439 RepID=UPI003FCCF2E9
MANQKLRILFILFCLQGSSKQKPISDKLDFEDGKTVNDQPDVTKLRFLCNTGGCNSTDNSHSIQTEVLVHVKTKVYPNRTESSEKSTSDVPILVGFRGSQLDETRNEEQFRSSASYLENEMISRDDSIRHTDTDFTYKKVPILPNRRDGNYYFQPHFNRFRPMIYDNTPQRVPGRFSGNDLEQPLPHFEHTYNRHYFGEAPPPQSLPYPKTLPHNPVAFNGISRSQWRPRYRPNKYGFDNHFGPHATNSKCTCEEQSTKLKSRTSIDDKLAPL